MEKGLWTLLIENLRQLKPKTRVNIIIMMIVIFTLWYALQKSQTQIEDELRGGKDAMIQELRVVISNDAEKILTLRKLNDSLLTLNGKLGIKIVMDSVKANTKIIDLNQKFIEQQNEIKRKLK